MGRKLVLSFSIIFVILPFLLILIFGGAFISETIIEPTNTELLATYSTISILSLLSLLLIILYFFLFAGKINRTPDVKWLVISCFIGFVIYEIILIFALLETLEIKYGFLDSNKQKILNELLFLPLILVPFTLVLPIFGFSKLYLTTSGSRRNCGSIII